MPRDQDLLEVARIVRPHGLGGSVVVELLTNRVERMKPGTVLGGPAGFLEVQTASALPEGAGRSRWLVSFVGVDTRERAESLREVVLSAEPLDVPDALWVHEMIGAEVRDVSGEPLGRVAAVQANPASDLLVLADGRLIPLRFVTAQEPGWLTVDPPPGLLDL